MQYEENKASESYELVILRCSPFFTASLEGWPHTPVSILRDAAQTRGPSG
jgi:hypothetical protein